MNDPPNLRSPTVVTKENLKAGLWLANEVACRLLFNEIDPVPTVEDQRVEGEIPRAKVTRLTIWVLKYCKKAVTRNLVA